MTSLCWKENINGKYCKNYRLDSKTRCRHHLDNLNNFNIKVYFLYMFVMLSLVAVYYNYKYIINQSSVNLYIYMTVNNLCDYINKISYNIYLISYRVIYYQYSYYEIKNLKVYVKNIVNYVKYCYNMYDNFLFSYTVDIFTRGCEKVFRLFRKIY